MALAGSFSGRAQIGFQEAFDVLEGVPGIFAILEQCNVLSLAEIEKVTGSKHGTAKRTRKLMRGKNKPGKPTAKPLRPRWNFPRSPVSRVIHVKSSRSNRRHREPGHYPAPKWNWSHRSESDGYGANDKLKDRRPRQ